MAVTGKSGADAIFAALHHICRVLAKYEDKLLAVIDLAVSAGVITAAQATTAKAFVSSATAVCAIFKLIAGFSGF